jgi:hypothetical protein
MRDPIREGDDGGGEQSCICQALPDIVIVASNSVQEDLGADVEKVLDRQCLNEIRTLHDDVACHGKTMLVLSDRMEHKGHKGFDFIRVLEHKVRQLRACSMKAARHSGGVRERGSILSLLILGSFSESSKVTPALHRYCSIDN